MAPLTPPQEHGARSAPGFSRPDRRMPAWRGPASVPAWRGLAHGSCPPGHHPASAGASSPVHGRRSGQAGSAAPARSARSARTGGSARTARTSRAPADAPGRPVRRQRRRRGNRGRLRGLSGRVLLGVGRESSWFAHLTSAYAWLGRRAGDPGQAWLDDLTTTSPNISFDAAQPSPLRGALCRQWHNREAAGTEAPAG